MQQDLSSFRRGAVDEALSKSKEIIRNNMLELVPTGTRLTPSRGSVRCGACCSHSPTPKTLSAPRQKRLIGGAISGNPKSSKEILDELQSRRRDFSKSKQTSPCPSGMRKHLKPTPTLPRESMLCGEDRYAHSTSLCLRPHMRGRIVSLLPGAIPAAAR